MLKLKLAGLLALGALSVPAQAQGPAINPSVDTAEQRQALHDFSLCLARARPRWARQVLAEPYLSDDQARIAAYALSGSDKCIHSRDDTEVVFRTSSMISSLAEHFLRDELGRVDSNRLAQVLSNLPPLNVSEDFGLCVASRNQAAARELALSPFNSAAETAAARRLADAVEVCQLESENLTVDLQSLRALTATALYRGVTAALGTTS